MSTPDEQVKAQRRAWEVLVEGKRYDDMTKHGAWRHLIGPAELNALLSHYNRHTAEAGDMWIMIHRTAAGSDVCMKTTTKNLARDLAAFERQLQCESSDPSPSVTIVHATPYSPTDLLPDRSPPGSESTKSA